MLPPSLNRSGASFHAEDLHHVRIPLTAVDGISEGAARAIMLERQTGGVFRSIGAAYERLPLTTTQHEQLAKAGGYGEDRRAALYTLSTLAHARPAGREGLLSPQSRAPELLPLTADEQLHLDLQTTGVTTSGRDLLDGQRAELRALGCVPLANLKHGESVWIAGSIVNRQKPPTARGFAFY